jgi:transposase
MRFVTIMTAPQQALAGIHRVRDPLMKRRIMLSNQLRGLMAEFGVVAAKGRCGLNELLAMLSDRDDQRISSSLREGLVAVTETLRGIERKLEGGSTGRLSPAGGQMRRTDIWSPRPATGRSCRAPWRCW